MIKKFIFLLAFCSLAAVARAEVSITAAVDKSTAEVGQPVTYTVRVVSTDKEVSAPHFPDFKGFSVFSQSQSTRLAFEGGKLTVTAEYVFALVATASGTFTIAPTTIVVEKKTYATQPFDVIISKDDNAVTPAPQPPPGQEPIPPLTPEDGSQEPQVTL